MFVKTNIGLQTPSHHPSEIHDQPSLFCHKANKFSKGRTFSSIISMCGHEWVNKSVSFYSQIGKIFKREILRSLFIICMKIKYNENSQLYRKSVS